MAYVRISAKTDYALRAAVQLAASQDGDTPIKGEQIATAQAIPLRFLENILGDMRNAGLVESRRGVDGGYLLARAADQIALADVIRAVDGPLANVGGTKPEALTYAGAAEPLRDVWVAVRAALREVLEETTVADVASGKLPGEVTALLKRPDVWERRQQ